MSDGVEKAVRDEEHRLRVGMRWLVGGSAIALMALLSWSILAAAGGSTAGMVAASSGSVAVVLAGKTGYLAIKNRREQIAASKSAIRR